MKLRSKQQVFIMAAVALFGAFLYFSRNLAWSSLCIPNYTPTAEQDEKQNTYSGRTGNQSNLPEMARTLHTGDIFRQYPGNLFVGVKDGHVAVYYGKPGEKAMLREQTNISVGNLTPHDREELQRGFAVQSEEEVLRMLEGLHAK